MFHINADSIWLKPGINERLIELHALSGAQTMTMRQIADKLSFEFEVEATRNGVIGRCHRLSLPMRDSVLFRKKTGPKPKKIHVRVEAPIEPVEAEIPPAHTGLTILQLCDGVCHWPLGEFEAYPPYVYCGDATEEGCSWCPLHFEIAHPRWRAA